MIPPSIGVAGKVVPHGDRVDRGIGPDHQAGRLDGLGQQPLDLAGDRGGRTVAVLGEHVAALPAARDLGEQQLVVIHADPDGRRRDAVITGSRGDRRQARGIGLAGVGVAVGEQQQRRAAVGGDAPSLLHPAQQPAGEVGHPAGVERAIAWRAACLSVSPPAGTTTWTSSSKATTPKRSRGVQAVDEAHERLLGGVEALAVHRAAAVEDDLDVGGRARRVGLRGGRDELEHHRDLVVLLDGDDIDICVGVHLHVVLLDLG